MCSWLLQLLHLQPHRETRSLTVARMTVPRPFPANIRTILVQNSNALSET
jgi:hypothetical protein